MSFYLTSCHCTPFQSTSKRTTIKSGKNKIWFSTTSFAVCLSYWYLTHRSVSFLFHLLEKKGWIVTYCLFSYRFRLIRLTMNNKIILAIFLLLVALSIQLADGKRTSNNPHCLFDFLRFRTVMLWTWLLCRWMSNISFEYRGMSIRSKQMLGMKNRRNLTRHTSSVYFS